MTAGSDRTLVTARAIRRRSFLAASLALLASTPAWADSYPVRAVTLIVPYAAGGTADILARIVAERMGRTLNRTFVVENRPGASGTIGCQLVASATPDGYTLLFTAGGPLTIGPHLNAHIKYDAATDFTPVILIAEVPSLLVVNPSSDIKTLQDLVRIGKANPDKLHFGSPGVGTSVHLLTELFLIDAGVKAVHIPYRGGALSMNDLLGGHIDFMFENVPQLLPQVVSGNLRALAVSSSVRIATLPEVPTLEESGFGSIGAGTWYGLLGPRSLDIKVVGTLVQAIREALTDVDVRKRMADLQVDPEPLATDDFAQFIALDDKRWLETIRRRGITQSD